MSKQRNEPIGEVECPTKGCTEKCAVFRFRPRGDGTRPGRNRFAGKVYADCPRHGRFGGDGKQATQDYILESGKIWGPTEEKHEPAPARSTPAETTPAPKPPAPSTPAPAARSPWKPLID